MKTKIMQKTDGKYGLATCSFVEHVCTVVDVKVKEFPNTEEIHVEVYFKEAEMDNLDLGYRKDTGNKSFLIALEALSGQSFTGPNPETLWALAVNEVHQELLTWERIPNDAKKNKMVADRVSAKQKEFEPTFESLCERLKAIDGANGWAKQVMTRYDLNCGSVFVNRLQEKSNRW